MTILILDPYFKIKGWIYKGILGVLVKKSLNLISFPSIPSNLGKNEIEWKQMKRIILEYFFFPLLGSFNGGNGKLIPLFGSLSGREWNG